MQFQIKSRYDAEKVLFACELSVDVAGQAYGLQLGFAVRAAITSGSNLSGSNLSGSNLRGSDLRGSDLRGSNLRGSDLSGSNLSGSNLSGCNLSGSNLFGEKIAKPVTQLFTEIWPVIIGETKIKIGCELHAIAEWEVFTDDQITVMDRYALEWWRVWKAPIMEICKATGKI